jgi:gas vesicle protein
VGAVVGAGLALIFAPMAGKETRRRIGEAAGRLKDGAQGRLDRVMGAVKDGAGDVTAAIDAGRNEFRRHAESTASAKESS